MGGAGWSLATLHPLFTPLPLGAASLERGTSLALGLLLRLSQCEVLTGKIGGYLFPWLPPCLVLVWH